MRSVVVGTVDSTRVLLEGLAAHGEPPAALVTLPPSRAARHSDYVDLRPLAARLSVPVVEAADVNAPEVLQSLRALDPDYLFVVGWSQICRRELLAVGRKGAIGYHPAPLPEYRGRAVIPWTILNGRATTGSTLFWMAEGMDDGDVLAQETFALSPDETAASLVGKHLEALVGMLSRVIPLLLAGGDPPRTPQDHSRATYCARRTAGDGLIDWEQPAHAVWTLIRAVGAPYPGAFTFARGRRITVWEADLVGAAPFIGLPGQVQELSAAGALVRCGDGGHVLLKRLQPEGGGAAPAAEVLRRHERLGISLLEVYNAMRRGEAP